MRLQWFRMTGLGRFRKISAALLLGAAVAAAPAQTFGAGQSSGAVGAVSVAAGPADSTEVNQFAEALFNRKEVKDQLPGGAVLVIVKEDQVLLSKGFGWADKEQKLAMDPKESAVKLASVSKVFTAAALMQLIEKGEVQLEDDIRQYLPGVTFDNPFGTPVTVRHLLTHTTGFDFPDPLPTDVHEDLTLRVEMEDYIKANMPNVVRKPGETYTYDNFASMLQGYIVQQVTGIPFHQYMKQSVFGPLGMDSSSFVPDQKLSERIAVAYGMDGEPMAPYAITPYDMPQGGMVSTGEDVGKFMMALLKGGDEQGKKLLTSHSVEQMLKVQYAVHPELPTMGYGFEFSYHQHWNNRYVVSKGGDIGGFSSLMWLLPKEKVGGFIIYNTNNDLRGTVLKAFMDHYYPLKGEQEPVQHNQPVDMSKYVGYYRDLRINYITKIVLDNKGKLNVELPGLKETLTPIGPHLFKDSKGYKLGFQVGEDGQVKALIYRNTGSSSLKLEEPKYYTDIQQTDLYGSTIQELQRMGKLGIYKGSKLEPNKAMTRSEFVALLMDTFRIRPSRAQAQFADLEGHPHAAAVQTLAELGILTGRETNRFDPNDVITRQEAAVILYRILQFSGLPAQEGKLAGEVAPWAKEAVSTMVAMGFYGPEAVSNPGGAVDYKAKEPLLRKQGALLLFQLLMLG